MSGHGKEIHLLIGDERPVLEKRLLKKHGHPSAEALADALAELSLPAAQSAIRRRMIYRKSIIQGRSVLDVGSQGVAAAEEIRQLVDEMVNLL